METPIDCPHCGVKSVAAEVKSIIPISQNSATLLMLCKQCLHGVSATYVLQNLLSISRVGQDLMEYEDFENLPHGWVRQELYPIPPGPSRVDYLPEKVATVYNEAELNFGDRRYASAAVMYRKALERLLQTLYPDGKNQSIFKQIEELQKTGALPQTMVDLCHSIRFLGNDGTHEMEDPTEDDVVLGKDFSYLLMVYLVELPAKIALASERRALAKERPQAVEAVATE